MDMDIDIAAHETKIQDTLAQFARVIELHNTTPDSQEVRDMSQDILGRIATVHGIGMEITDVESDAYRDAVQQIQRDVFYSVDDYGNRLTNVEQYNAYYTNPLRNTENLIAAILTWPPVFRNVALAVNIAYALFKQGITIEFDTDRPVTFNDGTQVRCGWAAFSHVFGNVICAGG